ncbi:MAG: DUF512 domain-containing protein [candidate division Zixibacteria bacterium]|nr:DUF512 domain-containing protein [candidate division Zixibacteria bacterium]
MKIIAIDPQSPLLGLIHTGFKLTHIDGVRVRDSIDCRYKLANETARLEFEDISGRKLYFQIRFEQNNDLGLTFEDDKILTCRNKCIFCFIHQQPKGMRHSLYVKDDDYRLSFTHGNFISLSNITRIDRERIVEQRLSPLYISVHSTDDSLRRRLFGNDKLPAIFPELEYFVKAGIKMHTQVVVCPGINDGAHLEKTINDLFSLNSGVLTVGIVPVGLTKYREKLADIIPFNTIMARNIISYLHLRQREFHKKCGSRFVFCADELYILARRKLPALYEYEEIAQFENGIGMMRTFLADFNRKRRFLKKGKRHIRMAVLTGRLAFDIFKENIILPLCRAGLKIDIFPVENRFWGKQITVSGLLTGRDILAKIKTLSGQYDVVLLPPNCLNGDGLFLDDLTLDDLRNKTDVEIMAGSYSMIDTVKEVLG